jgi:hypothetical protein
VCGSGVVGMPLMSICTTWICGPKAAAMIRTTWWCCAPRTTARCIVVGCGSMEGFRPVCGFATPTARLTARCRRRSWRRPAKGRSPVSGVWVSLKRPRVPASKTRSRALPRTPRQRRSYARRSLARAAARRELQPFSQRARPPMADTHVDPTWTHVGPTLPEIVAAPAAPLTCVSALERSDV